MNETNIYEKMTFKLVPQGVEMYSFTLINVSGSENSAAYLWYVPTYLLSLFTTIAIVYCTKGDSIYNIVDNM